MVASKLLTPSRSDTAIAGFVRDAEPGIWDHAQDGGDLAKWATVKNCKAEPKLLDKSRGGGGRNKNRLSKYFP